MPSPLTRRLPSRPPAVGQKSVTLADEPLSPSRLLLLGQNGPYRANNDLLHYALTLRVDPATKTIQGDNQVRFRMLQDGRRIQLDLATQFDIPKILFPR